MSLLDFLSSTGNALLRLDPETLDKLGPFRGKVFCIELTEPKFNLYLFPSEEGFEIKGDNDLAEPTQADVTLTGSLWSFAQMAKDGHDSDVFHTGRIQMNGDAELGQAFQSVLTQIDIDWEEILSKVIGDMAARQTSVVFGNLRDWFNTSSQTARQNAGEVLQEEVRLSPAPIEFEDFSAEVEELRSAVARLEARIKRLRQKQSAQQ